MGLACSGWEKGKAEVCGVGGGHGGAVWNEDGNAGVGGSFVGMGGMGCYKHAGGAGIGDSLRGERRGGSMIELVLGRES
jgi:hypothetical protein